MHHWSARFSLVKIATSNRNCINYQCAVHLCSLEYVMQLKNNHDIQEIFNEFLFTPSLVNDLKDSLPS